MTIGVDPYFTLVSFNYRSRDGKTKSGAFVHLFVPCLYLAKTLKNSAQLVLGLSLIPI